jgi:hypothetical protein
MGVARLRGTALGEEKVSGEEKVGEEKVSATFSRACPGRNSTALFLGTKRYLTPFPP